MQLRQPHQTQHETQTSRRRHILDRIAVRVGKAQPAVRQEDLAFLPTCLVQRRPVRSFHTLTLRTCSLLVAIVGHHHQVLPILRLSLTKTIEVNKNGNELLPEMQPLHDSYRTSWTTILIVSFPPTTATQLLSRMTLDRQRRQHRGMMSRLTHRH